MIEEWRPIKGFEGLYEVSNLGRVRDMKRGNILIPSYTPKGYLKLHLGRGKNYRVHRLVAQEFPEICGECFEKAQVDHINGIKDDNRAINLRWCTAKENMNNPNTMYKNSHSIVQLSKTGVAIRLFRSSHEAERETGVKNSNVSETCKEKNRRLSAGGYRWMYFDDYERFY